MAEPEMSVEDAKRAMSRSMGALALELPEPVWNDVVAAYERLLAAIAVRRPMTIEVDDVFVSPDDDTKGWRVTGIDSEGLPSLERVR